MPYNQREQTLTLPRLLALPVVIVTLLITYPATANADGLPSPRVFTRGANVYLVDSTRIVFLSMDTRSSYALYTAPDPIFSIVSVARSGDMIWASNGAGAVMGIDMQAGTVEEYGRSRVAAGGHIDVDSRYLWLAADDTLFRMDMVSREWVPIPIPDSDMDTARAVMSFNDQIHVVSSNAVYIYRPISGDWVTLPHTTFVLGAADFHRVENVCYFTEGKKFYRYDPSKRLWSKSALRDTIRAVSLTPEVLLAASENRVYSYNTASFTLEPQAALPALRGIRSITRHGGVYNVCALDKGLALYGSPFGFDLAYYPGYIKPARDVFAFSYYSHIILYAGSRFIIYNHDRRLWSGVPIVIRNREQASRYAWDENGAHVYLTDEYKSTLGGTASASAVGKAGSGTEPSLSMPDPPFGTVNLRTEDLDGRTLDITLDNSPVTAQDKGVYYRGADSDILNRASYGVQGTGMSVGQVTPNVLSKGASAVVGGRTKVGESDRSFLSATAGSGYVLSKTEWRTFPYDHSGLYALHVDGGRDIAASSVRMYIDGVVLSGADYVYDPASRAVRLRRRDRADPTSVIQVSFSLTAAPSVDFTEYEPVDHFGQYSFAEGAISPRSWLSARAGVLSMGGDTAGPLILASTPVEWRGGGANRSLTFIPEAAYDSRMGTHAAGVTLGAREGRAFGAYRGYWAARDFNGIDRRNFENVNVGEEHDIDFGYDLRDDLRVGWRQFHRDADFGGHTQFEAYSNYTGDFWPDVEIALSSRVTELRDDADRRRKETMYLRLSDLASNYLTQASRTYNVGYDFSLTEYRTNLDGRGSVAYGWASVSPTSKLTFTGSGTYRANPSGHDARSEINPTLTVNTRGLPAGVDAAAGYSMYTADLGDNGAAIGAAKNVSGYFYPGEYLKSLEKFALYLAHDDYMESSSPAGMPNARLFFVSDERTYYMLVNEAVGVIFFPMENIIASTYNIRTFETGALSPRYRTLERVKMWFENGGSIEGNLDILTHPQLFYTAGNAMYEHCWNENILTGLGAFGARHSENGSLGMSGGPQFKATLTKDMSSAIKAIENNHYLGVTISNNISRPNIDYAQYLRLKMSPNISVVGEFQAALLELSNLSVVGSLYLHAGF